MIRKVILILVMIFIIGCGEKEEPISSLQKSYSQAPSYGDTIIVGSIGEPKRLIPLLASDSASGEISGLIFNGLVKYDQNIKIIGDLAKSWDISKDNLVITFHLRPGVKWHDGKEFTAYDCLFTYEKLIDPQVASPYKGDFEQVKKVEVFDKYTFRVTYKEPFAPGLISWGMGVLPKHLLEKENLNTSKFNRHPIGTGPYKFKEWKTGQIIILETNENYFAERPYLDRYVYRIIPDQATMFLELEAGGLDYSGLTPIQYQRQSSTPRFQKKFNKLRYPAFGYTYLGYNLKNPKFSDKRVRQALTYAINKKEIINVVLMGLGTICTGPFPPESWAYNPNVKTYEYNPKKAKELLRQAGWKDSDGDGILDKEGEKFTFELLTNQGNDQRRKCAEIIQQRLGEIGIKVKILIFEWQTFLHEYIDKRRFEAIILGWSLSRDPDLYDIWHSGKTGEQEFNFISYKNSAVDNLLIKGRRIFDLEERKKIYYKIHALLAEEQPCTFLYVPDALPAIHKRFRGIKKAPLGIWYNFIKWYVAEGEQKYIK